VSAAPKRGLGRGLSALLGEPKTAGDELQQIPLEKITPNRFQPRKHFDEASLAELSASIAEYGVLVPIIVRARGSGYELVAGERRWRAAASLRQATIPAIVRESDDRDSLEVAIIENLQRENLGALEEAAGFASLMEEYAFTQEQLAGRLGKSRPAIANALRLLGLSDGIKSFIADGRLSAGHARALLAAPEKHRLALAQRAIEEGLSVRTFERLCGAVSTPLKSEDAKESSPLTPDEAEFESRLRFRLGAHVALRRNGKGGKIEIKFANEKELIRIGEVLLGEASES